MTHGWNAVLMDGLIILGKEVEATFDDERNVVSPTRFVVAPKSTCTIWTLKPRAPFAMQSLNLSLPKSLHAKLLR